MEIYHSGPVKFRPDCLYLAFTIIEHLGDHRNSYLSSLYQIVMQISTFSGRIIQANLGNFKFTFL